MDVYGVYQALRTTQLAAYWAFPAIPSLARMQSAQIMGVAGGIERMYDAGQFAALSVPPTAFLSWNSERRKTVNFRALPGWKATSLTNVSDSTHDDIPARQLPVPVSRRQFARTAAGSAFAAAVGSRLWDPILVEAASFAPVPIPSGSPALGGAYHVFGPAAF